MTVGLMRAPFPITYRELWLPRGIKGWTGPLPPSRYNGHELAFTGARRGTTCDGVHFTGAPTSNINCGAIHDNVTKLWISFRFKLDQPFDTGAAGSLHLFGKILGAGDYLDIALDVADGKIKWRQYTGAAQDFELIGCTAAGDITSWEAGRWYHVLASLSDTAGGIQRFLIDNYADADTQAAANTPNGGDFIIGDEDDPGNGNGFQGVIADFFCEEGVDLATNREDDLYRGIAPITADNRWLLDEGRGVTAYDRGVAGNNGTLDTSSTWAWGRVKQPIISLDGRNDHAQSAAGVDVSGAVTMVWAGKMKAHYDGVLEDKYFVEYWIDNNNHYQIYLHSLIGDVRFLCAAAGTTAVADLHGFAIEIDDYAIFIGTVTAGGVIQLFANGVLHDTDTGLAPIAAGGITTYIGAEDSPAYWDISKPLMVALIEGAFDQKQALDYSRWLDRIFNLGVVR